MTRCENPPLLKVSLLTKRPYIVTRYTRHEGDLIEAHEKYDVPAHDLLGVVAGLGVSEGCLDEVADRLGMVRTDDREGAADGR